MPGRKKGGGKKKGGGARKAFRVAAEKEHVKGKTKIFLRMYQANCVASDSVPCPRIITLCRECLEDGKPLTKVTVPCANSHLTRKHGVYSLAVFRGDLSGPRSSQEVCSCERSSSEWEGAGHWSQFGCSEDNGSFCRPAAGSCCG